MRTIYVNDEKVRIENGCGLFPLKRCPLQVWANKPNITVAINRIVPWNTRIYLWTYDDPMLTALRVQEICDECRHGEARKIQQHSQGKQR